MYKRLGLILLASLMLVAAVGISVSLANDSDGSFASTILNPFTQGHQNSGTVSSSKCGSCHSYGSGSDAHATHFKTLLLAFTDSGTSTAEHNGCGRCHSEGVDPTWEGDLSYTGLGANKKARKQVSQAICLRCHGAYRGTGTHAGTTINSNCLTCHVKTNTTGAVGAPTGHSTVVDSSWINRTVVDNTASWQYCTLCHGQDGSGGVSDRTFFNTTETNGIAWP